MSHSEAGELPGNRPAVTRDRVAVRAHELYVARGREDGHDLADWLQAEAELRLEPGAPAFAPASDHAPLRPRLARPRRPTTLGA